MRSDVYEPAGLLVEHRRRRVVIDGGAANAPQGRIDAWLMTDEHAELMPEIRQRASSLGLTPAVAGFAEGDLSVLPLAVAHTSHPTYGYRIEAGAIRVVWAPEFFRFPDWASGADLMFAEASGWDQPIRFAGGVGGHAGVLDVAREARERGVRRLVFAHIGRPTIRALAQGERPPFGEIGRDGAVYLLRPGR